MSSAVLMESAKNSWCTPESVLRRVRLVAPNGIITLDPCSNEESRVGASLEWYGDFPAEDGLALEWDLDGLGGMGDAPRTFAFVNPPYERGPALPRWCRKMAVEASLGVEIIGLLPARTETIWFQDNALTAQALCFWRGRITFEGADNGATFPSVLPYWGPQVDLFCEAFKDAGWVVRL